MTPTEKAIAEREARSRELNKARDKAAKPKAAPKKDAG